MKLQQVVVLVSLLLSIVSVTIVVPYGMLQHAATKRDAARLQLAALDRVAERQTALLKSVMTMQNRLISAKSALDELAAPVQKADEELAALRRAESAKQLDLYRRTLQQDLDDLEAATKKKFSDLEDQISSRKNRFLVKWHGDLGVKTSKRMPSEQEAVEFFENVGDFAKKLLMFDGLKWLSLREVGGERWLALMHNDGDVQDGDGKPTKAPPKAPSSKKDGKPSKETPQPPEDAQDSPAE